MEVAVKIGQKDVIARGSFAVADTSDDVSLKIADLEYIIKFAQDKSAKGPKVTSERRGDKTIELVLLNFLNPLGTFWSASVGNVAKRRLTLTISVHGVVDGKNPALLTYTFALGETVDE